MRYRNMSYLIGEEVELKEEFRQDQLEFHHAPDRIIVVNEYPKTLLIRKYYRGSSYQRMLSKASMYCGDVQLRHGLKLLTGKEVVI